MTFKDYCVRKLETDRRLTERDYKVIHLFLNDYAMRHKKCSRCKWADSDYMPDCRLKGIDVSTFQRIRANLCKYYRPFNPE